MDDESQIDLYNFIGALNANVPVAGYVTPKLLATQVYAVVGAGSTPPRYRFARHNFHHPVIHDLERPSILVFPTEELAEEYVANMGSDQFGVNGLSIRELFKVVSYNFGNTCGVMFRVDGGDHYANPVLIQDFNIYAQLGGLTLIVRDGDTAIEQDSFTSLTSEQHEQLCALLDELEAIKRYTIYGGQVEGIHTTVVDVVVKDDVTFEEAVAAHSDLLERCQAIASDVMLLVKPEPVYNEIPGFYR
ncbi:MAG: hypothetical protein U0R17_01380 [Acidimicrobiia bacterium]